MQERGHEPLVSDSDHFPTDAAGLPEARASEIVELADGDEFDLRSRRWQADRRGDGADARLQRLDPGPDAEGAARDRRSSSTS